jgi:hypothetical protein
MLQNVQKLEHIPETQFVILKKNKKTKTKLSLFGSICEDPPLFFFSNGLMFECDCTAWNHFVSAI